MEGGKMKKALILVDAQVGFFPGPDEELPVPGAHEIIQPVRYLLDSEEFDFLVYSFDWHDENHCSFIENGGKHRRHCVKCTRGAEMHPDIREKVMSLLHKDHVSVAKGFEKDKDEYSAFRGNIALSKLLRERNIKQVYVCGLATDYCVKATALDSQKEGFETFVIINACRGVDVNEGDVDRAIEEMKNAGIKIVEK